MAASTPAPIPAAQERTHGGSRPVTVIEPPRSWVPLDLRELWEQRELVYFLAWRDLKVRYKQTALGASWAILQPVFAMVVFSIFFGQLGRIPSDGLPYPLWSFAGLVPWTFFAQGLSQAANSLVMSQNLLRKVYFPRLAIPIATVLSVADAARLTIVYLVPRSGSIDTLPSVLVAVLADQSATPVSMSK